MDCCSVVGDIPSSLLNDFSYKDRFASIHEHIRTRLTCLFSNTSTDSKYICHLHDIAANLAASQSDTKLILNRGLTCSNDVKENLQLRGESTGSAMLGSVDRKKG